MNTKKQEKTARTPSHNLQSRERKLRRKQQANAKLPVGSLQAALGKKQTQDYGRGSRLAARLFWIGVRDL